VDDHRRRSHLGTHAADGMHQGIEVGDIASIGFRAVDRLLEAGEALRITCEHGDLVAALGKAPGDLGSRTLIRPDTGDQADWLGHVDALGRAAISSCQRLTLLHASGGV